MSASVAVLGAGRRSRPLRMTGRANWSESSGAATVCVLTLQRPEKLNALSSAVERALGEALASEALRDEPCRRAHGRGASVLGGGGCDRVPRRNAGFDPRLLPRHGRRLRAVRGTPPTDDRRDPRVVRRRRARARTRRRLPRRRRAAATFRLPEVSIGIVPSSGGTHRLVRLLGSARAKELVLLRDRVDAREALRLGLVTEVVACGCRRRPGAGARCRARRAARRSPSRLRSRRSTRWPIPLARRGY